MTCPLLPGRWAKYLAGWDWQRGKETWVTVFRSEYVTTLALVQPFLLAWSIFDQPSQSTTASPQESILIRPEGGSNGVFDWIERSWNGLRSVGTVAI